MEHKVWACAYAVNLFSACRLPSLGQGPPLCPGVPLSYGLLWPWAQGESWADSTDGTAAAPGDADEGTRHAVRVLVHGVDRLSPLQSGTP